MTAQIQESQPQETKPNDKELNFRALESKYQRELAQANAAREQAERALHEKSQAALHEDEDDDEPYVDKKKLEKKLARFGETTLKQTQSEIQSAVHTALREERKQNWMKANPDFYEVLQYAEKFHQTNSELADTILEMPDCFERQKLVYKNIKALGIHKPEVKAPSIQDKIDQNRKGPYYQPTGVGSAPYASQGDFSASGQKNAYDQMQELKKRMRI